MKTKVFLKLLIVIATVFIYDVGYGQAPTRAQLQPINARYQWESGGFKNVMYLPLDTAVGAEVGALAYKNGKPYKKDTLRWNELAGGGSVISDNMANANLQLTGNRTHNGKGKYFKIDSLGYLSYQIYRPDPIADNIFTNVFHLDSTMRGFPYRITSALRNWDNTGDSIHLDFGANENGTFIYNYGANGNQQGLFEFIGNSAAPKMNIQLSSDVRNSTYVLGHSAVLLPADSFRLKLQGAASALKMIGLQAQVGDVYTPVAIDMGNFMTGLSGDATANGPGVANVVLSNTGVVPGIYTNPTLTINSKGLVSNAVNGSAGVIDTTNKWLSDIRRRQGTDTVEKFKNGSWQPAYKDSTGGATDSAIFTTKYGVDTAKANIRGQIATKLNISDTTNKWISDIRRRQGTDTVEKFKNGSWQPAYKDSVGSGTSQLLVNDLGRLPAIKQNFPAQGIQSSGTTLTNYPITSLDSAVYYLTTTNSFFSGTKFGGALWNTPLGDSFQVSTPCIVWIGSSLSEGHPGKHGRLHPHGNNTFDPNYPDSAGQPSYHMRQYTNLPNYNHGIGGQTSKQVLQRWARDVLAQQLNFDPGDNRGTRTLTRKPLYVIYDGVTNDAFNGMTPQESIKNLIWMAQSCYSNNMKFIVCNSITGLQGPVTAVRHLETVNKALEAGILEPWGAVVFDQKTFWSDPAYGYDGIHGNPAIVDPTDMIHYTPAGSDSFALAIFRTCKIPRLTKIAFVNKLDPVTPLTNYAYIDSMTIAGVPYKVSKQSDTIGITSPLPSDSVWIKAKHITTVAGAGTVYGPSHIEWVLDNNPTNEPFYTRRTLNSNGANSQYMYGVSLELMPENYNSSAPVIDVHGADLETTSHAFTVRPGGAGGSTVINGGTVNTMINNSPLSVYKNGAGEGIGSDGNIKVEGNTNHIGNLEINKNQNAGDYGTGISTGNSGRSSVRLMATNPQGVAAFEFGYYSDVLSQVIAGDYTDFIRIRGAFGIVSGSGSQANVISIMPKYNQTITGESGNSIRGIYYNPTRTSLTEIKHYGILEVSGNNYFNTNADSTCIGCDSLEIINAKFRVNGDVIINTIDSTSAPANMLYQEPGTGKIKKAAMPSGGNNFANADLTFTADRSHDADSHSMLINNLSSLNQIARGTLSSRITRSSIRIDPSISAPLFLQTAMLKADGVTDSITATINTNNAEQLSMIAANSAFNKNSQILLKSSALSTGSSSINLMSDSLTAALQIATSSDTIIVAKTFNSAAKTNVVAKMKAPWVPVDQVHTSGTTLTISNGITRVFVDPASAIASLDITFPSSPVDGQTLKIFFGGDINSASSDVVTGGVNSWSTTGSGIIPTPVSAVAIKAGTVYTFEYRASSTNWYWINK